MSVNALQALEIVFTTALVVATLAVAVTAGIGVVKLFKGPA